jgi:hypothetical protein
MTTKLIDIHTHGAAENNRTHETRFSTSDLQKW